MGRDLHLSASNNPSVRQHLPAAHKSYVITSDGCSCDLYDMPAEAQDRDGHAAIAHKLRQKYERKGWSQAKIDRAVESKMSHRGEDRSFVGLRSDFREIVAHVASAGASVAVLVHWYHSEVDTEEITVSGQRTLSLSEVQDADTSLLSDIVHWIS